MNFEQAILGLQDTLTVMARIECRQAEMRKMQAEGRVLHEERMKHIDQRLSAMSGKLDRLIRLMNRRFGLK